jgi:hypothetical protein
MVKIKNKKGFLHTLEAVIAIILLLSIIYIVIPKDQLESTTPNKIEQAHKGIFSEITINQEFRDCLLIDVLNFGSINELTQNNIIKEATAPCLTHINKFIQELTPRGYVYMAEICDKSVSCTSNILSPEITIYAESIMLASKSSKVFRVYFWEK